MSRKCSKPCEAPDGGVAVDGDKFLIKRGEDCLNATLPADKTVCDSDYVGEIIGGDKISVCRGGADVLVDPPSSPCSADDVGEIEPTDGILICRQGELKQGTLPESDCEGVNLGAIIDGDQLVICRGGSKGLADPPCSTSHLPANNSIDIVPSVDDDGCPVYTYSVNFPEIPEVDCPVETTPIDCYEPSYRIIGKVVGECLVDMPAIKGNTDTKPTECLPAHIDCQGNLCIGKPAVAVIKHGNFRAVHNDVATSGVTGQTLRLDQFTDHSPLTSDPYNIFTDTATGVQVNLTGWYTYAVQVRSGNFGEVGTGMHIAADGIWVNNTFYNAMPDSEQSLTGAGVQQVMNVSHMYLNAGDIVAAAGRVDSGTPTSLTAELAMTFIGEG